MHGQTETMNNLIVCLQIILIALVAPVIGKSFGTTDGGSPFNRPTLFLGKNSYQNWKSAFDKRFGMVPYGQLGSRPPRWLDWSQIYGGSQKRGFGDNDDSPGLGSYPVFGRHRWSYHADGFRK